MKRLVMGLLAAALSLGLAACYWNKHEQTKRTFHGYWINTHDKFWVDVDGFYWYAGRTDDMIKVSGQAVWPSDVEGVLQGHPAVLESGVVGATDADGLVKPVAYVVLKDGRTPTLFIRMVMDPKSSATPPP